MLHQDHWIGDSPGVDPEVEDVVPVSSLEIGDYLLHGDPKSHRQTILGLTES